MEERAERCVACVAAIDSRNSNKPLLVADVDTSGTRQVARQSAINEFGRKVNASGEPLPEAIDRPVAQVAVVPQGY